jgi:hypothetical protein
LLYRDDAGRRYAPLTPEVREAVGSGGMRF